MPFGVIGVLLTILLILALIFGLLSYAVGPILAMAIFFFLACCFMILVVLIQRPKGGGLAGAFGGVGGAQQTAFGAKVGDVLTWVTVGFFVAFLSLAMGLTWKIKAEQEAAEIPTPTATSPNDGDLPVTGAPPSGDGGASPAVDDTPSPTDAVPDPQPGAAEDAGDDPEGSGVSQ